MDTADQARLTLTQATVTAIDIDTALRALNQALAGWPTQTPLAGPAEPAPTPDYTGRCTEPAIAHGQTHDNKYTPCPEHIHTTGATTDGPCDHPRPCPVHDTAVKLTTPETGATTTDNARHDLDKLRQAVTDAQRNTRIAADIAHSWATIRTDDTTVKTRLAMIDNIWCVNCSLHGFSNPRRPGGTVCDYCKDFKSRYPKYKCYPPKGVLDIWITRGKVLEADVHRVMRDLKANAKQTRRDLDDDWKAKKPDPGRTIEQQPDQLAQRRNKRLTA